MDSLERLTELFQKFPGIGPRQARRFVQYLLMASPAVRAELSDLSKKLGAETAQCKKCFRWFVSAKGGPASGGKTALCSICGGTSRDASLLFVVEKDADIENVERSGFRGLYFVLGGTIPLATEEPAKYVRLKELLKRIESEATPPAGGVASGLREVILGLSATTEGDHTRTLLQEKLLPVAEGLKFKLTSLGRGLSTGSELEYADPDTIAQALGNRH